METVIECSKLKDWQNGEGKNIPIYKVGLSDGRGGQSFGKEIPVGTPVADLVITDKGKYGLDFKLKSSGGGFGKKERGGNESFALAYAKDLVVAGKVDIKSILSTADKFYDWLEGKKGKAQVAENLAKPTDDLPF